MSRIAVTRPFTEKGRCNWCNAELSGRRTSWCSDACVNEWLIRHDPGWAAWKVKKRDHGVCALCGLDTEKQKAAYDRFKHWGESRWKNGRWMPATGHRISLMALKDLASEKYQVPYSRISGEWWDCDHIVPVVEGGGGCGLDNLRTLCIPCHKSETAKLARRIAERRRGQITLEMQA